MSEEATDVHSLKHACRVCGKNEKMRARNRSVAYPCVAHEKGLHDTFGIHVSSDVPGIHPATFCHTCYCIMKKMEQAVKKGVPYQHMVRVFEWQEHTASDCIVSS